MRNRNLVIGQEDNDFSRHIIQQRQPLSERFAQIQFRPADQVHHNLDDQVVLYLVEVVMLEKLRNRVRQRIPPRRRGILCQFQKLPGVRPRAALPKIHMSCLLQAHEFPSFLHSPMSYSTLLRFKLYTNYVKIWLKFYIYLRKPKKPLQNNPQAAINPVNPKLLLGILSDNEAYSKRVGSQKEPALLLRKNKNLEINKADFKKVSKPPIVKKIERTITPTVESMGFELVRVILIGSGKPTLQIMAEKPDGTITIDECGKLSQAISVVLDVENVLEDSPYYLEVGSPGIDRPLTRLKDFDRFAGQEARLEIEPAVDGRKRFKGTLKGTKGDHILIALEDGEKTIPFSSIERAKLIVPEEVIQPKQPKKSNSKK